MASTSKTCADDALADIEALPGGSGQPGTGGSGLDVQKNTVELDVQVHQSSSNKSHTAHFSKTYEHYIGPTAPYTGLVQRTRLYGNKWLDTSVWDDNLQFVPYNTLLTQPQCSR